MNDLEIRVRRLEDLELLRELKHRYAALCDARYDADGLSELFTEDAVWDGGVLGRYQGREEIRAFFAHAPERVPFAIHHVSNEQLTVDGDHATGEWYLWQPFIVAGTDERALWLAGVYHDRYRRDAEDGERWRFAHVHLEPRMMSPYELGWARARFAPVVTP